MNPKFKNQTPKPFTTINQSTCLPLLSSAAHQPQLLLTMSPDVLEITTASIPFPLFIFIIFLFQT